MPRKIAKKNSKARTVRNHRSEEDKSYSSLLYGVLTVVVLFLIIILGSKLIINRHKTGEITPEAANTQVTPIPELVSNTNQNVYKVQEGDSLWSIAEAKYSDGYKWAQIATANKLDNPDVINPGQKLTIPKSALEQEASKKLYGNTYIIKSGDNLWDIAVNVYADGYRWSDIAKANNLADPNLIYSGNVLKLPR